MNRPLTTSIATALVLQTKLQHEFNSQFKSQESLIGKDQKSPQQQEGEAAAGGNQQQQQQQQDSERGGGNQQQQQQTPPDPFKDLDLDLMDPAAREAITNARTEMARLHGRANEASKFQSERDKLLHQNGQYQQAMEQLKGRTQQQQQQQQPATLEEELMQMLVATGMTEAQAKSAAAYQAKMLEKFGTRLEDNIGKRFAPIVGNVVEQNVHAAFNTVRSQDNLGMLDINEVAQATYENLQAIAQRGDLVSPQVAENLASIYYIKYLREHPEVSPNMQQQQQQQQDYPNGNGNVNTRFTFPGAGHHARTPESQGSTTSKKPVYSAEEQAAMAATVENWEVKPAAYKGQKASNRVFVTRNGER